MKLQLPWETFCSLRQTSKKSISCQFLKPSWRHQNFTMTNIIIQKMKRISCGFTLGNTIRIVLEKVKVCFPPFVFSLKPGQIHLKIYYIT